MGALLHVGHHASLEELEELFAAALTASVARVCDRAGLPRFDVRANWDPSERWGVRAQSTAEQVVVVGSTAPPLGPSHWWHKPVILSVETADQVSNTTLSLPWLLNEDARFDAQVACQLGGAEGLYFGSVRVPSIIASLKPGLHRLAGRTAAKVLNPDNVDLTEWGLDADTLRTSKLRLDAVLVPDLGDIVPVSLGSRRGKRFTRASVRLARVLDGTDSDRILLPETVRAIRQLLDLDGKWLSGDDDIADVLERWLRGEGDLPEGIDDAPVRPTDQAGSRFRFWGHSLAYALHRGIRRSERLLTQRIDSGVETSLTPRAVSDALAWGLGSAVKQLLAGSDTYAGLHRMIDNTCTLSRIESFRQVSFYGPGALKEVRNRLDLRDLDEGWRNLLCPLQTPESTKVGLVRYLAASESPVEQPDAAVLAGEWGDLSFSACLVPFIDCDDAAKSSTGAKSLKQAVPIVGAAPPRVRTGWESQLAELAGASRSPVTGQFVSSTDFDTVIRKARRDHRVSFGAGWTPSAGPLRSWVQAGTETELFEGDVIAVAPDVHLDGDVPTMCLGVDALVALTPWFGLNHEDGIVVSGSYAAKLASRERVVAREPYDAAVDGEVQNLVGALGGDLAVESGSSVAAIAPKVSGKTRIVTSPVAGVLVDVRCAGGMVEIAIDVDRPLQVGDKLTNRHGGKGVVCAILPDEEMPRVGGPDGDVIDAILNPLGVLRRLNIGQLWEMHTSLVARLEGVESVTVGRRPVDVAKLAKKLDKLGAPEGRMPLYSPSGTRVDHGDGVVVGEQYLLKLDHLAANKARARGADSPRSPRTLQPSRQVNWKLGERGAGAQRLGEMELWALTALDLRELLDDVVSVRGRVGEVSEPAGVKPTLGAVTAHFAVAGLRVKAVVDGEASHALHSVDPKAVERFEVENAPVKARDVDSDFLAEIATKRFVSSEQAHPLYDKRHGRTRDERERVRWAIRLPFAVPHPWDTDKVSLALIESVPILPPALRAFGQDGLDARYSALAAAVREVPVERNPVVSGWADRVSALVDAVLGRSAWVDDLVRSGGRSWTPLADDTDPRPVVEDLVGTDEWYAWNPVAARPHGRGAGAIDPEATIAGRLRDKKGLLRRSLLGHAVQRSGRAVIVGDPERDPQTIGMPGAIFWSIIDGLADDDFKDVVLLNRQPTLRPNAMVALRAEPVPGDALVISPAILDCLAGDFDGDTAAVHWPVSEAARREAWENLRPAKQLRNYGTPNGLLAKLELDAALGLLLASDTPAKLKKLPGALGEGSLVASKPLNADGIGDFVAHAALKLDEDTVATLLAKALKYGASSATGFSIGALELLNVKTLDEVKRVSKTSLPAIRRLKQLVDVAAVDEAVLTQLLLTRGEIDTGRDEPDVEATVAGRYLDGLTPAEAYLAARGGILKLATKKLLTPFAGDLTKQLVEIGYEVAIDADDCGVEGPRDPLHCLRPAPFLCVACTSEWSPRPGTALGVLAGMVIGQRSTQLALKSNRASSKSPELEQIAAVFGSGGIPWPEDASRERRDEIVQRRLDGASARSGGKKLSMRTQALLVTLPISLSELLVGVETAGPGLAEAVKPPLHVFRALFKSSVHEFWAQVLLRQIWANSLGKSGAITSMALYAGKSGLGASTVRGNLNRVVDRTASRPSAETSERHRTSLLAGAWK